MALPSHLQLQIVSADKSLVNETVDEVEIPRADGYFGVLPGHTPLLALLGAGEMWYRRGTEVHHLVIALGFAEVQPDAVTILSAAPRYITLSSRWASPKCNRTRSRSSPRSPSVPTRSTSP